MADEKELQEKDNNVTDPQENEKDGNIFGGLMDKLHGNATGDNSMSEEESKEPGNQESIKDTPEE